MKIKNLSIFHIWLAVLAIIMVIGVIGALIVFTKGLVVTNLTDLVPWGLWRQDAGRRRTAGGRA